jgi:miniconductance mechanosensitive channel
MTHMVRQLDPTSGMPLEIYCFTYEKTWEKYEGITSDILIISNYYVSISIRNF